MTKRLLVIANPTAGTIFFTVSQLIEILERYKLSFDLQEVATPEEAYERAARATKNMYDAIAVFGGDGTVIAVLKAALKKDIAVLPLPGGSANMIVKHAGISMNIERSIEAYAKGTFITRRLSIAAANKEPFVLDMHFGFFSESVRNTPQASKRLLGEGAYHLSALLKAPVVQKRRYILSVDGKTVDQEAYACYVVNIGNMDIYGAKVLPRARAGYVRVMIVHRKSLLALIRWYIVRRMTGRNLKSVISTWYARQVVINKAGSMMSYDDQEKKASLPIAIEADSRNVSMIVPIVSHPKHKRMLGVLRVAYYRITDQVRRYVSGVPSERFSRIDRNLFLGGQYGKRAIQHFVERGITGVVSMRRYVPTAIQDSAKIEILHLPTTDMTAPDIEDLKKGIAFIERQIATGGSVYIHCRLGEGRGPTMAAAYLISTGMSVEDAIAHLKYYRPFVRPNKKQLEVLHRLARLLRAK